jgi:hypothetical protein
MRSIAPAMAGEPVAPAQQAGVELIEAGERWGGQLDVARTRPTTELSRAAGRREATS